MAALDELIAGRYRLRSLLGSGGMGTVWEAWDERLERRVAVKQLRLSHPGAEETELAAQRAMREARIAARLHHPYAVAVFDAVEHEGQPCLVMQFVDSIALSALLRSGGPLERPEAARVGAQVGSALAAAHAAGIVHRDVKPGNILIAEDGTALISDFGISHALGDATLTSTGLVHGTPAYLAPEVARGGEATQASDVFSLGSTLYAALEGAPPFGTDTNSIALLHRVAAGTYAPPQRSGPVGPLLEQMLDPDPDVRPTMSQVAAQLGDLGHDAPAPAATPPPVPAAALAPVPAAALAPTAPVPAAPPPPPDPTAPSTRRRRRRAPVVAGLAVLVALGLLIGGLWMNRPAGGNLAGGPASSSEQTDASATPTSSVAPSSAPRTVPASAPPAPTRTPSARPTESSRTPSPTQTPTPSPTRTRTRSPSLSDPPTAGQLAGAITDYYNLMPRGTDQAWPRMTASYQRGTARSRQTYERFWGAISRVSVSGVSGSPPTGAQATITYYYRSGRVVRERTAYGLIREDGRLKINSSRVLSSAG